MTGANLIRLALRTKRVARQLAHALQMMLGQRIGALYPSIRFSPERVRKRGRAACRRPVRGAIRQSERQELARLLQSRWPGQMRGGVYTLEVGDQALKQPWVREVSR